jgi:hypothetical protein
MHDLEPGSRKTYWIQNLLLKLVMKELHFKELLFLDASV